MNSDNTSSTIAVNISTTSDEIIETKSSYCCQNVKYKRIVDTLLWLTVLVVFALSGLGIIPPSSSSGFYCDDPTIVFAYSGDTVSTYMLFLGMLLPTLLVIVLTEFAWLPKGENLSDTMKVAWRKAMRHYGNLISGLVFGAFINEVIKTLVAEPRPHFLDTCRPDMTKVDCNQGFITYSSIMCTEENSPRNGVPRAVSDAMKSFPSGHAQLSTYVAVFMSMYIQCKIGTSYSNLWKHVLQLLFIAFALVCSISRVTDKRHHWWDVAAGMLVGFLTAYITVIWRCENFQGKNRSSSDTIQSRPNDDNSRVEEVNMSPSLRQRRSVVAAASLSSSSSSS